VDKRCINSVELKDWTSSSMLLLFVCFVFFIDLYVTLFRLLTGSGLQWVLILLFV